MEIRNLRAFVEVVRQGGFSRAAETVFATQSTVSKAVKQLETELGTPLLDRSGHRSTLTTAGEVVYRRAIRLLGERDSMLAELEDLRGLRRGTLRLGLPPVGSSTLFAPLFAAYRQRHPRVDIKLTEHGSDRLEEILRAGEIDLAASLLPVSEDFEWQGVRREPLVAILAEKHPLAGRDRLNLSDLRGEPLLLFETGFAINRIVLEACRREGFDPAVAARSSQIDFLVELAGAGLGIAFLPRLIAGRHGEAAVRRIVLDEPSTEWAIAIIWRRGAYLSHAARAWLALVREAAPQPA
ncbi:LysR substrate-binding domain-containing protein [Bosea thiooxidans]|nr:LysR family transcriptional regulator [Bosea sp. (in: a-proteobacteria)]